MTRVEKNIVAGAAFLVVFLFAFFTFNESENRAKYEVTLSEKIAYCMDDRGWNGAPYQVRAKFCSNQLHVTVAQIDRDLP